MSKKAVVGPGLTWVFVFVVIFFAIIIFGAAILFLGAERFLVSLYSGPGSNLVSEGSNDYIDLRGFIILLEKEVDVNGGIVKFNNLGQINLDDSKKIFNIEANNLASSIVKGGAKSAVIKLMGLEENVFSQSNVFTGYSSDSQGKLCKTNSKVRTIIYENYKAVLCVNYA
jgi:hypothetical protein